MNLIRYRYLHCIYVYIVKHTKSKFNSWNLIHLLSISNKNANLFTANDKPKHINKLIFLLHSTFITVAFITVTVAL